MKLKHNNKKVKPEHKFERVVVPPLFPRPICLEKCTMNIPNGYEENILMTLKAFSNEDAFNRKKPHKLQGGETWSLDVKDRNDKYRMLFQKDGNICKIINLCTEETH